MLSFLPEENKAARDTAREFAFSKLRPAAQEIEQSGRLPAELFRELGRLGLLGLAVPQDYGGSGGSFLSCALAMEELSRASAALALSYGAHAFLCAHNLYARGGEAQRRKYLPKLMSGEWIGAFALTEPEAGSDGG